MDEVIAASGMSSAAVYRYFRSKEEIIHASAREGVGRVAGVFAALLASEPCLSPAQSFELFEAELRRRTDNPGYDMTRIALQAWAEALRDPVLHDLHQEQYRGALDIATKLARRWRDVGYLPATAEPEAVATTLFTVLHGLIVVHLTVGGVDFGALRAGLAALGSAV